MFKKAQAAMEFLMTYGWAILVVLVVIGALAYFGVLSPSTLLPEKCTFPVSVNCLDHQVTSSAIKLVMLNGAGRDMSITSVSASSDALTAACATPAAGYPKTLRNGEKGTFDLTSCTATPTGRDKNRYNVTIRYKWSDSDVVHELPGELLARTS